ncbi:hypothetical protein H9654_02335 [Stenotrophomonas sp. Sa5BUN4]|jgi:hypothetical protein|uniref:Uncharacterized protein n=1 Tax=Stenotrophomonas lacuserhaii TaxID=2760084 RepID=A0A8X8FSN7_9GAMM|nr:MULTISPECIES: hypothetical protein [Stenotrophomonas]MBD7953031.1 hypothetical protein [Stenotrophomonas pennii]MDX3931735.1 hypothetical protein [Stenotrophomonas sp.]PKH71658.1 hypothetical protein CXF90_10235 [Stenotrophomonas sp. Betaine-02u-23]PKH74774.1 hypothetical protein CXF96_06875 [Stenotrophomonas sp. Betaine-02u-21]PKH95171.1 hypothetical protein CXG43_14055 [Stenotrophomonas sp. Bg11-02]
MTPLDKPLRRELQVGADAFTLTIDPDGLKLVRKGKRNGIVLRWEELVNGDAALAKALQASLQTQ